MMSFSARAGASNAPNLEMQLAQFAPSFSAILEYLEGKRL